MANISYTKKANNTWKFTIRQGQKYLYSKSGFTEKEEAEEEAQKAIQGIENVGYGRGFYLMSNGMTVADLCHIWVEENPSTSESSRAKDRIALKIADEYFSNYDVLEMTFDKFKNQMIHLQYDLNIKLYILQHLTAMI
ncbi:MAG: hypothetical protein ACRCSZ_09550, partial [Lactococcus lactis]